MADIDETQTPELEQDEEQDDEESGFIAPGFAPDEQDDTEAAPELAPPVDRSEKEIEDMFRKVERAAKLYTGKLEDAFGDDFKRYAGCPLCAGDFPGYIDLAKVGGFPRDVISQVNEIMTGYKQVEYKQLPGFQTCPVCEGEGKGYTGSKVPGQETADCPNCQRRGFLAPMVQQGNGHAPAPSYSLAAPDEPAYVSGEDVDSWGEPRTLPDGRDNPNFGRMPQFKTLVDPYGITANLTARETV